MTAALAAFAACSRPRTEPDGRVPVDLGPDDVWIYATHPMLPLEAPVLRAATAAMVNATPGLVTAPAGARLDPSLTGRLTLRLDKVHAESSFEVTSTVRLTLPSGREWHATGRGTGSARSAFQGAVREGLDEALWASRAEHLSDAELVASLGSPSPRRRRIAVTRLASRRHQASFEPLVMRLEGDCTSEPASVALGGLTALGDVRAVGKIVEALERCDDPTFSLQATYALGGLGGIDAEAYLFTMAAGHSDPRLRKAAQEAHAMLLRHAVVDAGSGVMP